MKRLNETMRKRQETKQEVRIRVFGTEFETMLLQTEIVVNHSHPPRTQDIDKLYEAGGDLLLLIDDYMDFVGGNPIHVY